MPKELDDAMRAFLAEQPVGVLATTRRNGRHPPVDGGARILTTAIAGPTMRIFERIGGGRPAAPLSDEMLAGMKHVILELTIEEVRDASCVGGA